MVDFLEGDHDQPIITGRTYHANNKPPYKLPEHKTRMSIKSKTHKGKGFNELRFEDENGREEIFVHAQRDRNEITERDYTHLVKQHRVEKTQGEKSSIIDCNNIKMVRRNDTSIVQGSYSILVGKSDPNSIEHRGMTSFKDEAGASLKSIGLGTIRTAGSNELTLTAAGDVRIDSDEDLQITGKSSTSISSSGSVTVDSGKKLSLTGKTIRASSTDEILIHSAKSIKLICGKSCIELKEDGSIKIDGVNLEIDLAGKANVTTGSLIGLKSNKIKIN